MIYPVPPLNPAGKDDMAYWEGFLSDDEINQILALPQWLNMQEGMIGGTSDDQAINHNIRCGQVNWFYPTPETAHIWDKLSATIAEVNRTFFHFNLTGCHEPAQLGLYTEKSKDHYDWHTDDSLCGTKVPRKLSMSLLLSDPSEFEGGEFQVMKSATPETLNTKKGRAWFFPSWMLHRVTPVTKGVRRSLVIWVGGPAFK